MYLNIIIVILLILQAQIYGTSASESDILSLRRSKRYFFYPFGGGFKMVIGVAVPVPLPAKHQSLGWAVNIQFQYPVLTNLTEIQSGLPPIITSARKRRRSNGKSERALTYMALETIMDKHGFNGKACLLRSICENAMYSLVHENTGLYGEFLDILLDPNDEVSDLAPEYHDARKAGNFGVNCISLYPECPEGEGPLDLFTYIE